MLLFIKALRDLSQPVSVSFRSNTLRVRSYNHLQSESSPKRRMMTSAIAKAATNDSLPTLILRRSYSRLIHSHLWLDDGIGICFHEHCQLNINNTS